VEKYPPCQNSYFERKTQTQSNKKAHSRIHIDTEIGFAMPSRTTPTGARGGNGRQQGY
jgi:hypothetical protein